MLAVATPRDTAGGGIVCPNCGTVCAGGASPRRIAELEAQVRILTDKASSAGT